MLPKEPGLGALNPTINAPARQRFCRIWSCRAAALEAYYELPTDPGFNALTLPPSTVLNPKASSARLQASRPAAIIIPSSLREVGGRGGGL